MRPHDLECLLAARRLEHRVPVALQRGARDMPHFTLILGDENRLGAAKRLRRCGRDRWHVDFVRHARQVHLERRAVTALAVHPNRSAALLDDAVHGRETKTRAFAALLGREERLENPRLRRLVHSGAGIGDGQHHVRAGDGAAMGRRVRGVELDVRRLDRQLPARQHRVASVDREVDDDLLDLPRIGVDAIERRRQPRLELDVLADQPPQQRVHADHDFVEIQNLRVEHLPAAEGQQLPCE